MDCFLYAVTEQGVNNEELEGKAQVGVGLDLKISDYRGLAIPSFM